MLARAWTAGILGKLIFREMRNLAAFTAIVALGNLGVTIWHLRLASELNPALSFAEAARISALTMVLTLGGVSLLWAQRRLAGSLVLVVVFAIGLVVGASSIFSSPVLITSSMLARAAWRFCSDSAWLCSSFCRLPGYGASLA